MRRKEKEIANRDEIDGILKEALVCRVAFARSDEPYLVPLFYGYDGKCLYFHSAREGKKIVYLRTNSRVCFEVERNVELITHETDGCAWSARFESVIGFGRAVELTGTEEKTRGLNTIMEHYSRKTWRFDPKVLEKTAVWGVEIESLTGKRSID